jgi:hypothetical protein
VRLRSSAILAAWLFADDDPGFLDWLTGSSSAQSGPESPAIVSGEVAGQAPALPGAV